MPVAIACGRVLRARTSAQRVDACLKAAEVLTRYLAGIAVASFASRDAGGTSTLSELSGNLSFGHFLTTVQEVAAAREQHPAAPLLAQGFKTTKRNQETLRGKTDGALVAMLQLRNDLGHELRYLDEGKATAIEESADPMAAVQDALQGVEELLSKPLFVVENQEWTPDAIVLRRLLLMGESADPTPQTIKVDPTAGVGSTGTPYVAINKRCLRLPPWLLWGIDQGRQNFALLFLDAVEATTARYCTLDGTKLQVDGASDSVRDICSGTRRSPEVVVLLDGSNFARDWAATRDRIEESGRRQEGLVDWHAFDPDTVQWFAGLLNQPDEDPHRLLRERLLDGRHLVEPDELRQLMLLFGRPADVRGRLQRDVLDLRVIDSETP
ncbi:MAG: hypothetical protein KDD11_19255, partial [Acidobacteria bacterium]|nr:hypothetical protein [Acidobacteriota bacterium]